jgi:hypothetical protein
MTTESEDYQCKQVLEVLLSKCENDDAENE